MASPSSFSPQKRQTIRAKSFGLCFYCGVLAREDVHRDHPQRLTYDHIVPASQGGTYAIINMVIACKKCNGLKKNLSLDGFREMMGGLFAEKFGSTATEVPVSCLEVHNFCKELTEAIDNPLHELWFR